MQNGAGINPKNDQKDSEKNKKSLEEIFANFMSQLEDPEPPKKRARIEEADQLEINRVLSNFEASMTEEKETQENPNNEKCDPATVLPVCIMEYILSFLSLHDLMNVQKVNSIWNKISQTNSLWENLDIKDNRPSNTEEKPKEFINKIIVKRKIVTDRNELGTYSFSDTCMLLSTDDNGTPTKFDCPRNSSIESLNEMENQEGLNPHFSDDEMIKLYPTVLIKAFGSYENIKALSVLDLSEREKMRSIESICAKDMKEAEILRGFDASGNPFISFCIKHCGEPELNVLTISSCFPDRRWETIGDIALQLLPTPTGFLEKMHYEYLGRLIRHEPCGIFQDGRETRERTVDGESVIELTDQKEMQRLKKRI